jgi:hypothetical protein
MFEKPTLRSLAQYGTKPQRITSKLRSPAFASYRTTGRGSVGATFQLAAMFGVGRCGGIEKTSLISLTSEERRFCGQYKEMLNIRNAGPQRAKNFRTDP